MAPERADRPSVRIAHLGIGAFGRSHQAWYTQRANDATGDGWGIAGFTGRSPHAARVLSAQDGVYTLIERGPATDRAERIEAVVAAHDGADPQWERTLADPAVALVTVTVSEAGYAPGAEPARRLAAGLEARRRADAGPISLVGCDNLLGNGAVLRAAVEAACAESTRAWIAESVGFVDTMVDRITPATTADDIRTVAELAGWADAAPVVAEPFAEWVLADEFVGGRPAWESAGARFVDDVRPYEERKLWLLNAGHTLLATAGRLRGHATVDEAFADPDVRTLLEQLWVEQRAVIEVSADDIDRSLAALRDRFANGRIRHRLDQIGAGGVRKLPPRILEPMRRRRSLGMPAGSAQEAVLLAWADVLEREGPDDAVAAGILDRIRGLHGADRLSLLIDLLSPEGSRP